MDMNSDKERTQEFKRNEELEHYLKDINGLMALSEDKLLSEEIREYPIVFVMGAHRSGTTLMMQWLADTGEFAYPTNLMSRFYGAPIMGAKIQRLLTEAELNYRDEIYEFNKGFSFESNNGKTKGALEPNEFWYFWRRFVPDNVSFVSDEKLLSIVDCDKIKKELYGIAQEFQKPLALKGMICNYNIGFLDSLFPKAIFIWMKRDMENNVISALEARKRQYGTYKKWYSFIIPEYEEIIKIEDPKDQVRQQILSINNAISLGISKVNADKQIIVNYEEFCEKPCIVYKDICSKLKKQGYTINENYIGKESFRVKCYV